MSKSTLRNLIIALVALALVGGVVSIAFFSVLKNSQTLEKQIAAVAAQNQQEATLIRLQKIAQSSEVEREELASYFLLRESETSNFLSDVETLAPTMGVKMGTPDLKRVPQENNEWIEITFNVSGNRSDLYEFIDALEIVPYVSRITTLNLSGQGNGSWRADIIIQVQLLTYD